MHTGVYFSIVAATSLVALVYDCVTRPNRLQVGGYRSATAQVRPCHRHKSMCRSRSSRKAVALQAGAVSDDEPSMTEPARP